MRRSRLFGQLPGRNKLRIGSRLLAGTTVVYAINPLQRCLRDIFTGMKHGVLTPAILGRIGKVRLGLEFGTMRV